MRVVGTIGLLLLAGCSGTQPIKELLDNAFSFDSRTVRIVGEVKPSVKALGEGVYQVDIRGCREDLEARLGMDERGNPLAQQPVIVDEHQGNGLALRGHSAGAPIQGLRAAGGLCLQLKHNNRAPSRHRDNGSGGGGVSGNP